jgi:hypothetical protein
VTVNELANLVREMRATQVAYFKDRSPVVLRDSKRLERLVDQAIETVLGTEKQKGLGL